MPALTVRRSLIAAVAVLLAAVAVGYIRLAADRTGAPPARPPAGRRVTLDAGPAAAGRSPTGTLSHGVRRRPGRAAAGVRRGVRPGLRRRRHRRLPAPGHRRGRTSSSCSTPSCATTRPFADPGPAQPGPGVGQRPDGGVDDVRRRRLLHQRRLLHPHRHPRHPHRRAGHARWRTSRSPGTGGRYRAVDVNFWGVTFTADDNRFYATMSTGGQPLPGRRRPRRPDRADAHRQRRVPVAVAGRHPDRVQAGDRRRPDSAAGGCRCSTWPPCGSPRSPRRTASTTRRPGSTTAPSPTPCATATATRTSGRCRPTARVGRRLLVPDAESPATLHG